MSHAFPDPVVVEVLPDGGWRVYANFRFLTPTTTIYIPQGMRTDFASTPRIVWPIIPPYGRYSRAALVHDYLYGLGDRSKAECDALFLEGMRVCGVGRFLRTVMWLAVLCFGGRAWRAHRHAK